MTIFIKFLPKTYKFLNNRILKKKFCSNINSLIQTNKSNNNNKERDDNLILNKEKNNQISANSQAQVIFLIFKFN